MPSMAKGKRLTQFESQDESEDDKRYRRPRNAIIIGASLTAVILVIIIAASLYGVNYGTNIKAEKKLVPPDPETVLPPSWSKLGTFKRGAVCADGAPCAVVGKSILERNGSAVDAALASMICNGLVNMQSMGLGGGFIMTIYEKSAGRTIVLNARDRAPLASNSTMFDGKPKLVSSLGPLSIAVPGELAGYWEAHQKYGNVPWPDLFQPSIELCETGYNLTKIQYDGFYYNKNSILSDPTLKGLFIDPETNDFIKPGSIVKPKLLCQTLRAIAASNSSIFYNGTLGEILVEDLQKKGSIITMNDLNSYRVSWESPLNINLSDGLKVFTPDVPGSGGLLALILNVFDELTITPSSFDDFDTMTITYQRMIETFKYAFAFRSDLGDKHFINMTEVTQKLTSREYARSIRRKLNDSETLNDIYYYGSHIRDVPDDSGTAHVSVLAPNGDAVSVTSTINYYFGSGIVSERTGIILNNAMDDFSVPSKTNYFGIPPSPRNYIDPGKQPVSSMVPTIIIDAHDDVKMVVGAAGGTKITTAVAQVIAKILWGGKTVKEAVDDPRVHHQLLPMEVSYEYGVPKQVVDGLRKRGHKMTRYRDRGSIVCSIFRQNSRIYANADYRKGGDVYGVD